jgi:hypothetical protein
MTRKGKLTVGPVRLQANRALRLTAASTLAVPSGHWPSAGTEVRS